MGIAVVTGAGSGIGAACVARLQAAGDRVAGIDLRPAACDLGLLADVSDAGAVEAAIARVEAELGPIDRLVTAAGYYERVPLLELDEAGVARMVAVHVTGTRNVLRAVIARMAPRGAGAICTIGSELALCGDGDAIHYAMSKGAIHALTKTLALELAPTGIRLNCVAPGPTDTPLLTTELRNPAYIASLVLQRLVTAQEIAAAVTFALAVDEHNLVGQVISPNAGAVV